MITVFFATFHLRTFSVEPELKFSSTSRGMKVPSRAKALQCSSWIIFVIYSFFSHLFFGKRKSIIHLKKIKSRGKMQEKTVGLLTTFLVLIFNGFSCVVKKFNERRKNKRSGATVDWPLKLLTTNLVGPFWLSAGT